MDQRALDEFVTNVLNDFKAQTKDTRESILHGRLGIEEYREEAGVLIGVEMASQILIEKAREHFKETLDD